VLYSKPFVNLVFAQQFNRLRGLFKSLISKYMQEMIHSDPFRHSMIRYPGCAVNKSARSHNLRHYCTHPPTVLSLLSSDAFLLQQSALSKNDSDSL